MNINEDVYKRQIIMLMSLICVEAWILKDFRWIN